MASGAFRDDRTFLLALVLAGTVLRLLWLFALFGTPLAPLGAAEASAVATAFARSGTLADAYFAGQGPTAHLMPFNPAAAGSLIRWLGEATALSAAALLCWSLAQVFGAYLLLHVCWRRAGMAPEVALRGTAVLFLLPVFVPQETIDFRYWEGGTSLLLAAAALFVALAANDNRPSARRAIALGLLSACALFVSPPAGIACCAAAGFAVWRGWPPRSRWLTAAAGAATLALLIGLWSARNERELGSAVPTRSNLGIELAIANHEAALAPASPERTFAARLAAVHPAANAAAQDRVRQEGEVAYARSLRDRTVDWIVQHPASFVRLSLRHSTEFLFPRPWQFYFTGWEGLRTARSAGVSLFVALGLIGVALGWMRGHRLHAVVAIYVVALTAQFAFFQPMPRYTFLAFAPLAYPAVEVASLCVAALHRRMRQIGKAPDLAPPADDRVEDQPREPA